MAGNRQHILPKFLLKGFASRIQKKEIFTWVYQRDGTIFETNIKNVGVEKYFYGRKGEPFVDHDITKFEGAYAPLLDELRGEQGQVEISDHRIPDLITHLVIRTKHVRDSFRESSEFLIEKICEYLQDSEIIKNYILRKPEIMRKSIEEGFRDHPELRRFEKILRPLLPRFLIAFLDSQKAEIQRLIKYFLEKSREDLPKWIRTAHIKGLSKGLIPEPRVEEYRQLRWFVYESNESIILGDIGCLFEVSGTRKYKSLTLNDDEIINVFLPISYKQILIGTSLSGIAFPDFKLINEAIAKCSRNFFICSEQSPDKVSLIPLLGKEAELITKEEIEEITKEIFLK
jgi:hypothetical protein